ncbi:MAG: glycosyltransferase, partial [Cyanobacteria bacterium J06558_2]
MSIPNLPKKIAIFIPSSAVGGAEHYVKNILSLIESFGCKPTLILPKNQQLIDFFSELPVAQLIADIAWIGGAEDLSVGQTYLNKLSQQYSEAHKVL